MSGLVIACGACNYNVYSVEAMNEHMKQHRPTNDSPASVEEILRNVCYEHFDCDTGPECLQKKVNLEMVARINQLLTEARIDEWRKVMGDGDVDMDRMAEERIAALKDGQA